MAESGRVVLQSGEVDLSLRVLRRQDGTVRLTPIETRLLAYLSQHVGEVHSPERLLEAVWGYSAATRSRTVTVTIERLRRKIEINPSSPRHLCTVWGGYVFSLPPPLAASPGFFGREADLERLNTMICAGEALLSVVGSGGIGKTTLVREAAALARARGVDVVTVDLTDVSDASLAVARIAAALEIRGDTRVIARALAARAPLLLVLDDLDALIPDAAGLEGLLGAARVTVLVSARSPLDLPREIVVRLDPIDRTAAEQLLRHLAKQAGAPQDRLASPALTPLAAALEGLPLAIVLAAPWLSWLDPVEIAARLAMLADRAGAGGKHGSLSMCVARSLDTLDPDDRRALTLLCCYPGALPIGLCEALLTPEPSRPLDRIALLERRSLLSTEEHNTLRISASVRASVAAQDPAAIQEGRARAFEWARATARLAVDSLLGSDAVALRHANRHLPLIEAAIEGAVRGQLWVRPACDLIELWLRFGINERGSRLAEEAVALASGDAELSRALHQRARIAWSRGVHARADLDRALVLASDPAAKDLAVRIRVTRGIAQRSAGDFEGAQTELLAAAQVATGAIRALVWIERAVLARSTGAPERAAELLVEAQAEARRVGCLRYDLLASATLASCQRLLGQTLEAEIGYRRALANAEALHEHENIAIISTNLANLLLLDDRPGEAVRLLKDAQRYHHQTGNLRSEAFALHGMAVAQLALGHTESALRLAAQARDSFRISEHSVGAAMADGLVGRLLHHLGRPEEALLRYDGVLGQWDVLGLRSMCGLVAALASLAAADVGDGERSRRHRARAEELLAGDAVQQAALTLVDRELAKLTAPTDASRQALRTLLAGNEFDRAFSRMG